MVFQSNFTAGTQLTISGAVTTSGNLPQPNSTQTLLDKSDNTSRSYPQTTDTDAISWSSTGTTYLTGVNTMAHAGSYNKRILWKLYDDANVIAMGVVPEGGGATTDNMPTDCITFPNPIAVAASSTIALKIFNIDTTGTITIFTRVFGYVV